MNNFEIITKFLPSAVDSVFAAESKTAVLENGSKFIDVNFNEAGYIKIAELLMDGLSDYYSVNETSTANANYAHYAGQNGTGVRDGFQVGSSSVKWELHKLQWKRGKQFQIDYISDEEVAAVTMSNLLNEFNKTKVVPEVDASRFATMAGKCSSSLGNFVSETIAENKIIASFNTAFEWLSEHEVPEEDQVIFVSPAVMTLIRNSTELTKFLTQVDYKNGNGVDFTLQAYNGRPIIVVPSNRFFTGITLTSNGYLPTSDAKTLNYMVCSKKAVIPLRKVEYSKVFEPSVVQDFYGYKIDYLLYHGIIIPKNKVPGIYVSVSATSATTKANILDVVLKKGTGDTGSVLLEEHYTSPAGLNGTLAYKTSSSTISSLAKAGDVISIDGSTWIAVEDGANFKPANVHCQFVLVGTTGTALAVSGDVDVTSYKK